MEMRVPGCGPPRGVRRHSGCGRGGEASDEPRLSWLCDSATCDGACVLYLLIGLAVAALYLVVHTLIVWGLLARACREIEASGGDVDAYLREVERGLVEGKRVDANGEHNGVAR